MKKDKEVMQGEKLSHYLDQLNDGNCPLITDQEIEELIETAAVVQQSYTQNEVPRLLIDEMVTTLANELGGKKQKRRIHWLYGGFACAAATLLIIIGTQFLLPRAFDQNIAREIDESSEMEMVAVADQGNIVAPRPSNPVIEESAEPISSEKIWTQVPIEITTTKSTDSISKVIVETIQVAQSMPKEEKNNQVAILEKEAPREKVMEKNQIRARMDMNFSAQVANKSLLKGGNTMLVQPNQVAQSIIVDQISGVIRQVYNEGMDEQIIITQRTKQDGNKGSSENLAVADRYKQSKNHSNSLTVKIDQYFITIEGNKTTEELQKIVESLVFKNIE